jgi:hypothetical protein
VWGTGSRAQGDRRLECRAEDNEVHVWDRIGLGSGHKMAYSDELVETYSLASRVGRGQYIKLVG